MRNLNTGSWPTATLIRVVRGKVNGAPVRDALAACDPIYPSAYTVATGEKSGELIVRGEAGDRIDEWVALVPAAAPPHPPPRSRTFGAHPPAARRPPPAARPLAHPPALRRA